MTDERSDYWQKRFGKVREAMKRLPKPIVDVVFPKTPLFQGFKPGDLVFYAHDNVATGPGLPQTATAWNKQFAAMRGDMIALWQSGLRVLNPNMSDRDFERGWAGLTRSNMAFTNGHGPETDDFKVEYGVFCPGATFRVITGEVYRRTGKLWVDVYAYDVTKAYYPLPDPINLVSVRHLWFFPNIAPTDDRVNPVPQFNGRCVVPVWYPGGKMPVRYERLVSVEYPLNPFRPERPNITAGVV